MGWFKKKEEQAEGEIQELPELPNPEEFSLPEPQDSNDFSLPELPESDFDAEPKDIPELPKLPELKTKSPAVIKQEKAKPMQEMQKSHFETIEAKPRQQSDLIREINKTSPRQASSAKNTEPIYVRLDKFETGLQSIEEIKRKIEEIEEILKKTREVKQKEEQELEAWERETQIIKSRIDAIDKTLFNKLD